MDISLQKAITTPQTLLNGSSRNAADLFSFSIFSKKKKKRSFFKTDTCLTRSPLQDVSQGKIIHRRLHPDRVVMMNHVFGGDEKDLSKNSF